MWECTTARLDCLCDTKPIGLQNSTEPIDTKNKVKIWKAKCVSHYTHSLKLTERILDKVFENSKDPIGLMNHHNLRAGREVSNIRVFRLL